jgi:hypothetical protein
MTGDRQKNDEAHCNPCNIRLFGFSMTRIILWLIAITIVSFVIGFGMLALSGGLPPASDHKMSPFRSSVLLTPNTTPVLLDGAGSGEVRIVMGAGEISLQGDAPSDTLLVATVFSKAPEWQPEFSSSLNTTRKSVTMMDKGHKAKEWVAIHSPNNWEIQLNDRVPLDLTVNVGAGDSRLRLGSLNLTSLTVDNGAGDTEIDLEGYRGGRFDARIMNGVGDITLRVPKNSNSRVILHHGVGDVTSNGFEQHDESYTTPGFSPLLPTSEILVKQGVGSINIEAV